MRMTPIMAIGMVFIGAVGRGFGCAWKRLNDRMFLSYYIPMASICQKIQNPQENPRKNFILNLPKQLLLQSFAQLMLELMAPCGDELHDLILHVLRLADLLEDEMLFGAGGLHLDIAIVDDGGESALGMDRDVLDLVESELRYLPIEKTRLHAVDDPHIGHDPRIERIHGQAVEKGIPEEHVIHRGERREPWHRSGPRDESAKENDCQEGKCRADQDDEGLTEQHDPVPVQEEDDFFALLLAFEGVGGICEE
jgi:hypothetical protein